MKITVQFEVFNLNEKSKYKKDLILTKSELTIGRKRASLEIEDKKVSKIHCTLRIKKEAIKLIDNDSSSNGIIYENEKMTTLDLEINQLFQIGDHKIRILNINFEESNDDKSETIHQPHSRNKPNFSNQNTRLVKKRNLY